MRPYKYWRITNIVTTVPYPVSGEQYITIAELDFVNDKNLPCVSTGNVIFSSEGDTANRKARLAFDKDPNTIARNSSSALEPLPEYWIGYGFTEPVIVTHIKLQLRQDRDASFYQDIKQAKVQASDDAVSWVDIGWIYPFYLYPKMDVGIYPIYYLVKSINTNNKITLIPSTSKVKKQNPFNTLTTAKDIVPNIFSQDYSAIEKEGFGVRGYISGRVYEQISGVKVPVSRKVYLYHQASGNLIGTTWSDKNGLYIFKNLRLDSTYMVVSVDPNKVYGLEGVAFKKAREVVTNGLQVSYPIID